MPGSSRCPAGRGVAMGGVPFCSGSRGCGHPARSRTRGARPDGGQPRPRGASEEEGAADAEHQDRKSTRLNSSHVKISYAVFCLKKKQTSISLLVKLTSSRLT